MATDTAQLVERFREIRQELDLRPEEAETQAQNKALAPLHAWLWTGVDTPEVVIRAVQVLMADPERPAIHKRPAVNQVFKQISQDWESAGLKEQDVLVLRGMLLATWTRELREGGFKLAPLLDSVWMATAGRPTSEKRLIEDWRHQQLSAPDVASRNPQNTVSEDGGFAWEPQSISAPDVEQAIKTIQNNNEDHTGNLAKHSANVFREYHNTLTKITTHLNKTDQALDQLGPRISHLSSLVSETSSKGRSAHDAQLDLLWWGQARYSRITRQPYRRLSDSTERLWWMAWESSELAMNLDVEPAACFLIETLHHLDDRANAPKRPLKEWLAELIGALRRVHENGQHVEAMSMSERLKQLAGDDPLSLPVTWARLQATNPKPFKGSLEERIRTDISLDPDTLLDLGDWAAWVFREALLDRHLEELGEQ